MSNTGEWQVVKTKRTRRAEKNWKAREDYELANLCFNMSGGLPPHYLTHNEKALLQARFGPNWLVKLGYPADALTNPQHNP